MQGGVLTSSDFYKQRKIEEEIKSPPIVPEGMKLNRIFCFPPAPKQGISRTVISFEGKQLKLELIDGKYTPPKTWKESKLDKFRRVITEVYGFVDVSTLEIDPNAKKKTAKQIYKALHPDSAKEEKYSGDYTVKVKGKEQTLQCVEGIIETESKEVLKALLKKGFIDVSIEEAK